jgi:hypothetical protein
MRSVGIIILAALLLPSRVRVIFRALSRLRGRDFEAVCTGPVIGD